jgi:hypothetical protein
MIMRRRLFIACLCAALLALPALSSADEVLYAPESIQEHSQWCWAGSSQAVLQHFGTYVEQCEIANWAWGRTDCCGNTDFDWDNTDCNYWNYMYGTSGSLQGILSNWGVGSDARAYALDQAVAVSEIDAGRPFVMRFGWTSGGGHFLAGYGYDQSGTYLDYMDPWPGNGYTKSLYTWVVSATGHAWSHTLQVTTDPASACAPDPLRIGSTYYPSVNEAYNNASAGQAIEMKAMDFTEALTLSRDIDVSLQGGYNCSFSTDTGLTKIRSLTVTGGTVTVQNLKIR